MRRKVAFSWMIGLILVTMLMMTAIARDDEALGHGALQADLLGSLDIIGVSNPKGVNLESIRSSTLFVPLAGKTAIHLAQGYDFVVLDRHGTHGRAESQLPDSGIDPFIVDDAGGANTRTLPFEAA